PGPWRPVRRANSTSSRPSPASLSRWNLALCRGTPTPAAASSRLTADPWERTYRYRARLVGSATLASPATPSSKGPWLIPGPRPRPACTIRTASVADSFYQRDLLTKLPDFFYRSVQCPLEVAESPGLTGDPMTKPTFLIVGASLTGARAAAELRPAGFAGRGMLIGAEPDRPYERPPLTKDYLRGESEREKAYVHPGGFYAQQEIELVTGVTVTSVEPGESRVTLDDGRTVGYDRLLLATGAEPR